jgi:peptidoglycan/xylan/chitin deacetylase (PgdA/CDA1 family)
LGALNAALKRRSSTARHALLSFSAQGGSLRQLMSFKAQIRPLRRWLLSELCSHRISLNGGGPIVSFAFDDFPRTALHIGGEILKGHGARGTYYAAIGLMNTCNHLGELFRREDLHALWNDGHELASHTFSHVSCRSVSRTEFREEVQKGRRAIEEITGKRDSGSFALPFGEVTLNTKRAISAEVASCRGIWPGLNGPQADLNLLRANSLYGGAEGWAQAEELILENERRKSWLIFYSHDVRPNPSAFGCTPELLDHAVSFAVQRGARVLTVAETVSELVEGRQEESPVCAATAERAIPQSGKC